MSVEHLLRDVIEGKQEEFHFTENAIKVLRARYLKKDDQGKPIETPDEMLMRVAECIGGPEKDNPVLTDEQREYLTQEFYQLMRTGIFMPNSPTLMNAGREMGMLSACFVLPIEDSIDGIFTSIKHTALIQKAGGGTGFSFSRLRPCGDIVKSSGGNTSGPLSFLKVFSEATNAIQQGAFRRGANMGVMDVTHPDIIDFIKVKEDRTQLTNYNLSVAVNNDFMETLKRNPDKKHTVINPRTGEKSLLPKKDNPGEYWAVGEIMDLMIKKAHNSGEPGLLFMERINEYNPTPHIGMMEATNPCGEQPLLPYEACNLGSIDVSKFVDAKTKTINYDHLTKAVHVSTRFLDNVVDANRYPIPEIDKMCKGNRKIGLGVMGYADLLYKLDIPYDSEEAIQKGEEIMKCIQDESHKASEELAREKGEFPYWKGSTWDVKHGRKIRNACTTTVAPTGTISIIADCSCGIEPLFSLAFYRNILNGQRMIEVNKVFKKRLEEAGIYSEEIINEAIEKGTIQHIKSIPQKIRDVFKTAHDVTPDWHLRTQAAFQRQCDSSISKTINFSHDATLDDMKEIFQMAYDHKLKGVTVYRDGCRENQPMALDNKKEEVQQAQVPVMGRPVPVPEIMTSLRIRQNTPFGNMHVKICIEPDTGIEREVFAQLGKGGDIANSDLEAICRLLSLFLRSNGSLEMAVDQLDGIGSSLSVPTRDGRVMSLADGLAKAIKKYYRVKKEFGLESILLGKADIQGFLTGRGKVTENDVDSKYNKFKVKCPECSGNLIFEEGCVLCHECGYTKC